MEQRYTKGLITQSSIIENAKELLIAAKGQKKINLFRVMTANESIELALKEPDPVYLYPNLILQNEFTICFAEPGAGKTAFCFDVAKVIAEKGYTVIYLDLEF